MEKVFLLTGPERRRSLNAWMQQRRDQRGAPELGSHGGHRVFHI